MSDDSFSELGGRFLGQNSWPMGLGPNSQFVGPDGMSLRPYSRPVGQSRIKNITEIFCLKTIFGSSNLAPIFFNISSNKIWCSLT